MPPPIITLTTDFGLQDHYVGTMKGVLLSRCPDAQLVDLAHDIPPFSIHSAAYILAQSTPYFPAGTVHLAVVDPGVGSPRKALLAVIDAQFYIAPDNGVLSLVLASGRDMEVRELSNRDLWLPEMSATFHGRDLFAPVAGSLAAGRVSPREVGPVYTDFVSLPGLQARQTGPGRWEGLIWSVDRFGNIITNFRADEFQAKLTGRFELSAGLGRVTTLRPTFSGGESGVCFVYPGSSGYLEIGLNQGNAGRQLSIHSGESVALQFID